ncbi:MAG: hypothetical protein OES24_01245 [Acidimicrobiia bacterium]|nr:hypothetical protein [Acidimicrobiia bacterium]
MTVLVAGAAATWAMVGLIWLIQLVHYPMLVGWSTADPVRAAAFHQRRISFVVGPLMAVEGVTALVLLVSRPDTMGAVSAWAAAALLGVALASTVLIQVPLHGRLAAGPDEEAADRLCSTNWIRTVAWTLRGLVLAAVLIA